MLLPVGTSPHAAGRSTGGLPDPELLAQLLASEQGGRKRVGSRAFYAVLNQADTPQRQLLGKQTLCVLQERYRVNGVLTQFEEGERA